MLNFTSKEVFAERKNGNTEQAYKMAKQLMANNPNDEWNQRALAWCLVDLIKHSTQQHQEAVHYINEFKLIDVVTQDELLTKQLNYFEKQNNPLNNEINLAREASKSGKHKEAANIYFKILKQQLDNLEIQTSFAWSLYFLAKETLSQEYIKTENIKRYFFEYFKLNIEKPSKLHHCFLFLGLKLVKNEKLAKENNIDFSDFCLKWDLEYLNWEDYQIQKTEGNEFPPFALDVFRNALKSAMEHNNHQSLNYLVQFIEDKRTVLQGETIWLEWDLAKSYHFLNQDILAKNKAFALLKSKPNEYWLWDFLGDIYASFDKEMSAACYSKAITLQKDIGFNYKIKFKLANYLISKGNFEAAKCEINEIIDYKKVYAQKIPEEILSLTQTQWYLATECAENNQIYYKKLANNAEGLLYSDLPWIDAYLGDVFENNDKKMRKMFIKFNEIPTEISLPESRLSLKSTKSWQYAQLKGEFDSGKFRLFLCREIDEIHQHQKEFFAKKIAIVDNINNEKNVVHLLVSEKIDAVISIKELNFNPKVADVVEINLSQHTTKDGKKRYKVHHVEKSEQSAPNDLLKCFDEQIRENNGIAFTENSNIFIPSHIVKHFELSDGDCVSGIAMKNYDKKKNQWGWKAITINPHS